MSSLPRSCNVSTKDFHMPFTQNHQLLKNISLHLLYYMCSLPIIYAYMCVMCRYDIHVV